MDFKLRRLYLERLERRVTLSTGALQETLSLEDNALIAQLTDINSDFYRKISVIECLLASSFDFIGLCANAVAKAAHDEQLLVKFTTAFDSLFSSLLAAVSQPDSSNSTYDMWRMTTKLLMRCGTAQKLSFWQKNDFDQLTIVALRAYFSEHLQGPSRANIEILSLLRPKIIREMFGEEKKTRDLECIAELVDECLDIPAVYCIDEYEKILAQFATQEIDESQVMDKIKAEMMEILNLPAELTEESIPQELVNLAHRLQKDKNSFIRRAERKMADKDSALSAIVQSLQPFCKKYDSADKIKAKLQSDWRKTILPRLLSYLGTRTELSEEQKQKIEDLFEYLQSKFGSFSA